MAEITVEGIRPLNLVDPSQPTTTVDPDDESVKRTPKFLDAQDIPESIPTYRDAFFLDGIFFAFVAVIGLFAVCILILIIVECSKASKGERRPDLREVMDIEALSEAYKDEISRNTLDENEDERKERRYNKELRKKRKRQEKEDRMEREESIRENSRRDRDRNNKRSTSNNIKRGLCPACRRSKSPHHKHSVESF